MFSQLHDLYLRTVALGSIGSKIDELILIKSQQNETDLVVRLPELDQYIEKQLLKIEKQMPDNPPKGDVCLFDAVFRNTLAMLDGNV